MNFYFNSKNHVFQFSETVTFYYLKMNILNKEQFYLIAIILIILKLVDIQPFIDQLMQFFLATANKIPRFRNLK